MFKCGVQYSMLGLSRENSIIIECFIVWQYLFFSLLFSSHPPPLFDRSPMLQQIISWVLIVLDLLFSWIIMNNIILMDNYRTYSKGCTVLTELCFIKCCDSCLWHDDVECCIAFVLTYWTQLVMVDSSCTVESVKIFG